MEDQEADSSTSGLRTPSVSPRYTPKHVQEAQGSAWSWDDTFRGPNQPKGEQAMNKAVAPPSDVQSVNSAASDDWADEELQTSLKLSTLEELPEDQLEELLQRLEKRSPDMRLAMFLHLTVHALWRLASSAQGSRFFQEALERAEARCAQQLAAGLRGHVGEAWDSPTSGVSGAGQQLQRPADAVRLSAVHPEEAQDCWFHVPDQLSSDQAADTAAASLDARWVDADVAPEREEEETSLGFGAVEELPEDQFEELLHLLEDCNPDSRLAVLLRVTARALWRFASSAKGSRFLQEALERADAHGAVRLAAGLNGHVSEAWDSPTAAPHANHVVQVCLQALPPAQCHFVLDEMREGGVERAGCSKYGCRILQRIIEHFPAQDTSVFVEELLDPDVLLRLAVNRFGNFVVQCVLEHGTQVQRVRIADLLLDQDDQKFSRLCENMYASHVVQKAMKLCHEKLQELLLARIVRIERSDSKFKRSVYGSFVVHEARKLLKAAAAKAPTATPLAEANRGAMRRGGQ
eukprot:CAMPEP_0175769564 /NCGR_PEP_ID=MMETSP0097-20121207/71025_1 /TAXON_ID=311494 /ORGANISM="Alexandrium monilatum, Strain CCMP3105" /LENGTH=518 /DNA_ID=CAMNT_0017079743 /DNA_START=32 /DNA_END=1586 /DNA_ORIENTATION=-